MVRRCPGPLGDLTAQIGPDTSSRDLAGQLGVVVGGRYLHAVHADMFRGASPSIRVSSYELLRPPGSGVPVPGAKGWLWSAAAAKKRLAYQRTQIDPSPCFALFWLARLELTPHVRARMVPIAKPPGKLSTSLARAQATGPPGRLLGAKKPKSPKNRQKSYVPAKKAIFPYETAVFSIRIRTAREELLFFWCFINFWKVNKLWQLQRKLQLKRLHPPRKRHLQRKSSRLKK